MRSSLGHLSIFALVAFGLAGHLYPAECTFCLAQNIFDEETSSESQTPEQPGETDEAPKAKLAAKGKKKKTRRRKINPATTVATTESPGYTPEELARQSYAWAPEPGLRLKSTAPGIKPEQSASPVKVVPADQAESLETPTQKQAIKLPQIPTTQVLIVAGFVILFLIYRFRIGRQMKRRKY